MRVTIERRPRPPEIEPALTGTANTPHSESGNALSRLIQHAAAGFAWLVLVVVVSTQLVLHPWLAENWLMIGMGTLAIAGSVVVGIPVLRRVRARPSTSDA